MVKFFVEGNFFYAFCILTFFSFVLYFGTLAGFKNANSDFPNYYVSAQLLMDGNLNKAYSTAEFDKEIKKLNPNAQGLFVMYPPGTSVIMLPFLNNKLLDAKIIWVIFSTALIAILFYILIFLLGIKKWHTLFIIAGAGFNLVNDLILGQVYIFTVVVTIIAVVAIFRNKQITSGILLGIVASLKLYPLLFIPILFFKKKFKLAISLIIAFLIINLFVFYLCGADVFISFFESFKINYIQKKVAGIVPISIQYQSIEALKNILINTDSISDFSKNCMLIISKIWTPLWGLILASTLFLHRKSKHFLEISFACILLFLLVTEVGSATYHLLLIMPVFALIFYNRLISNKIQIVLFLWWFVIGFFPTIYLKLNIENLIFDFNRLWLLTVFCIVFFIGIYNSEKNLTKETVS